MSLSDFKVYSTSKQAWDAMYQAISNAQKSIYWELYIFLDDEAGNPFFDVLEQKARQSVDVKLIVDSWGSFWLSNKRVKKLKKAGVDIRFFYGRKNKIFGWWKRFSSRSHRKVLVVDEKVAFVGGVNIQKHMRDWKDIQVRMSGKVIHSLLRAFAKSYVISGGKKKDVKRFFKYKFRVKSDKIDLVYDDPHIKKSKARKKYSEALLKARERVILFSPYYFPDKKFLYALWKARKRGIRIDLLIPYRADIKIAKYASYTWFALLNKIGVNIHLTNKMLHGKGVIMDDEWAMVGSSNLDQTSFYDNYETNVRFRDKIVVKKIKDVAQKWIKNSKKLKDLDWKKRGRVHKFKEWIALKLYKFWHGKR